MDLADDPSISPAHASTVDGPAADLEESDGNHEEWLQRVSLLLSPLLYGPSEAPSVER